ncbi:MAG: hypothetical protein JHC95_23135 [Solirubrobacteraceae bacterium]|nr:hypothetical protein [Solirubrobacteraceae bacterium]
MTFCSPKRATAVIVLTLSALTFGAAQTAGAQSGDTGPPATKKECLQRLKKEKRAYAATRKAFPAKKKAATDKVDAQRKKHTALKARYAAIQAELDTLQNTNTSGLTDDQVTAINARIDALVQEQREVKIKIDEAEVKVHNTTNDLNVIVKKYKDDMKNWPIQIKHIKAYCDKM